MNSKEINKNLSIGVDIVNIDEFKRLGYPKDKLFLNKVFSKNELKYCFSKESPAAHLAARFSGKEAVIKALSGLTNARLSYNEIEIVTNRKGAPLVKINNKRMSLCNLHVQLSLSHCEDKAVAFSVAILASTSSNKFL